MTRTERQTVVGVFTDRARAQQAINELKQAGFRDDQIGVTARGDHGGSTGGATSGEGTYTGEGAAAGIATGAGIGALWGLGVISGVLPAIGPAIAGGTLAALLSSAAAGAAAAGIAGALIGMGIPKEEAEFYESEWKGGRTIVTVKADGRGAEALTILRRHGGYEMSTAPTASSTGATGHACKTGTPTGAAATSALRESGKVQAREEQLHVQKQPAKAGEVKVRKEVHTEHQSFEVPVEREEVVVERHPVSGCTPASGPVQEGQTIRVPVTEEHIEVHKTPVVKEEVTISKKKTTGTQHVGGTVRKEEIKVEKEGDVKVREQKK
jgi:uncharacterized protein (TIGR02271 family)